MSRPIFLPPKGFRPSDLVVEASFCRSPAFASQPSKGNNPSAIRGLNYERKVHNHLSSVFNPERGSQLYVPAHWITFRTSDPTERGPRYAQPDGLLVDLDRSLVVIVEIKLRHMQSAWWGLRRLYEPLIRKIFGNKWSFAVCEIVDWYDPAVFWPEPYSMCRDPSMLRRNEFGVMILSSKHMREAQQLRKVAHPIFPVGL